MKEKLWVHKKKYHEKFGSVKENVYLSSPNTYNDEANAAIQKFLERQIQQTLVG